MSYTIKKLAKLAGVSVRTLHHYDEIGLLKPARSLSNKYRQYEEADLLKLQQIMFFCELDFPLRTIKEILNDKNFQITEALLDQKKMLTLKRKRLDSLLTTIDKTVKKIKHQNKMADKELYDKFDMSEVNQYADEAKKRWGKTEAWKESQERTKNWTKADYEKIKDGQENLAKKIAEHMKFGPKSPDVQKLILEHYNFLRNFYEPNLELYRGLADMYVSDERFKANYDKHAPGLAEFMRDSMHEYCDTH